MSEQGEQSRYPMLLFDAGVVQQCRERAQKQEGLPERLAESLRRICATDPDVIDHTLARDYSEKMLAAAEAMILLGQGPSELAWVKRRMKALLAAPTWKAPVHAFCPNCDHVMTNVAAHVAYTHDLLGAGFSDEETGVIAAGLRRHLLDPYLKAVRTRDPDEWWTARDCESNWKIMCHGEAGFAICAFADHWPEADEALEFAGAGVSEVLDLVAPEGDWREGVDYWFATLFMGLRFASAWRRRTNGKNLFNHPALKKTGDFGMMMTSPAGRSYDFNDNNTDLTGIASEAMLILAREQGRNDWLHAARKYPTFSPLWLALDDPAVASELPARNLGAFPHTGVVTMRSGWEPGDIYIGFKSSSPDIPHSHLDANSFVLEKNGVRLMCDEGCWPYAHRLGFFDDSGPRWNWDNLGTVGHNTILVDGQGQTFGPKNCGIILKAEEHDGFFIVAGDASACYPGLLTKFVRTLTFIPPGWLLVRDVIRCEGNRHVEWLMHTRGTLSNEGVNTRVRQDGEEALVIPLLPDRSNGWRITDSVRTSIYMNSNTNKEEIHDIRYRSFAPFRAAGSFEFLMLIALGATDGYRFEQRDGAWQVIFSAERKVVKPDADMISVEKL